MAGKIFIASSNIPFSNPNGESIETAGEHLFLIYDADGKAS